MRCHVTADAFGVLYASDVSYVTYFARSASCASKASSLQSRTALHPCNLDRVRLPGRAFITKGAQAYEASYAVREW